MDLAQNAVGRAARDVVRTVVAAAAYGFAAGLGHDLLYAARNLIKLPLLLLATAVVCAAAFHAVGLLLRLDRPFTATLQLAFALFHDLAVLLSSLAPVVLFLALVLHATDDGQRGEYDLYLAANMVAIALCGTLALIRQVRALQALAGIGRRRARAIVLCWLSLALLVGGQGAFWMRPFFGYPATRGVRPPWFLATTPDLRGARNFFEAVVQALRRVELPSDLNRRIEELRR